MAEKKFESSMEKVGNWIETRLAPPLVKLGNEKHMAAIRTALMRTIPLIIVGSIPLIFTSMPFEAVAKIFAPYADKLNVLNTMSMGFITLWLAISLGFEFGKMYEELDPIIVSMVTVCSFLITVEPVTDTMGLTGLSAKGMFALFVVAIIVVEFMHFSYKKGLIIKMPKAVPAAISQPFASLLPMLLLLVFFWLVRVVMGFDLTAFLNMILSPIISVTDTWYAVFIATLLLQLLWFVGIHGGSFTIWGPLYPILLQNITENAAAKAAGLALPHIMTEPFFYSWTMIGGTGSTLPLVIIWLKSKSAALREVAKVSLIPGIFCVNEPMVFGTPIVLNPLMFIPFVFLTSLLGSMYGYVITKLGLVSATYVQIPWSTPPLLQPFLATGGDFRAVLAQIVLIAILFVVWYPFAKVYEKKMLIEEEEYAAEEAKYN